METIAVTGGTGEFGRAVIDRLLLSDRRVVATVRNPDRGADLLARGVTVRPGNFDDPATLRDSLAGVTTVFVNATFIGADIQRRGTRFTSAIQSAVDAGVARIVLAGWPEAESCPMPGTDDFLMAEQALRSAGPEWTIVREGVTIANPIAREVAWAMRLGSLRAPAGESRCAPAAITDLAEATAAVLITPDSSGVTYEFSGPRSINWAELADLAGELAGQPIRYEPIVDADFDEVFAAAGGPAAALPGWRAFHAAFRSGWGNRVHPDLAEVLGRAPVDTREAVRRRVPVDTATDVQ